MSIYYSDELLRNLRDKSCPTCDGEGYALVDYIENFGPYYELCECCWGRMVHKQEYFERPQRHIDYNFKGSVDEFEAFLKEVTE